MESDWKKFSAMIPMLRERYLAAVNAKAAMILTDPRRSETERFWDAMELMEKEAKVLRRCLDGHSRSKMEFFMLDMIAHGMLKQEDLAGFGEELRGRLSQFFPER
ncbi:MAG TPA: hypothetical protein VIK52_00340 [Opitutaceae bacterium]